MRYDVASLMTSLRTSAVAFRPVEIANVLVLGRTMAAFQAAIVGVELILHHLNLRLSLAGSLAEFAPGWPLDCTYQD